MKPGNERTLFCITDLKENWILRNLNFGEVLAILASRPRSADADLLFWNEDWADWKGLDDSECLPFRTPRVETQTPPPVPLVPVLMGFEPPKLPPQSPPTTKPSAPPMASRPVQPAPDAKIKKSKPKTDEWVNPADLNHPVLGDSAKAPSLLDLMKTAEAGPKLSVNPEFQKNNPGHVPPVLVVAPPDVRDALPDVLQAPPAPPVVKIPEPIPISVGANVKPVTELKPTAPPKLMTKQGLVVPPPPGFDEPLNEDTPPPFNEETRAPAGHTVVSEAEDRPERTEVTSVQLMDRHPKVPRPREGGAALRKFERYAVQMPVVVQTTTEQFTTWTLDISEGGIRTKDPLPESLVGYAQVVLMPKNRAAFHLLASQVEDQTDGRFHLQFMDSPSMIEFITWLREQSFAA